MVALVTPLSPSVELQTVNVLASLSIADKNELEGWWKSEDSSTHEAIRLQTKNDESETVESLPAIATPQLDETESDITHLRRECKISPDVGLNELRNKHAQCHEIASQLSRQFFNVALDENASRKKGHRFLLATDDDLKECYGFLHYHWTPGQPTVEICRMAVCPKYQKHGFGGKMFRGFLSQVKKMRQFKEVIVSSLSESVGFWSKLGFQPNYDVKLESAECDYVEGQVYMERRLFLRKR
eukprot:Filipodium_phascolosomae@DN6669_c0_g1_i1.p1